MIGWLLAEPEDHVHAITLRNATPIDAAALGCLHAASWRETYTGIIPAKVLAGQSVETRTVMWDNILNNPEAFGCTAVIVAEDDGRVIGFGSCGQQRDRVLTDAGFSGEIGAIYVFRAHQNRGTGGLLMAAMSRALSDAGHTSACLWVLRENTPARSFYERLGGMVVSEKVDDHAGATFVEVAYGWTDLSGLVR